MIRTLIILSLALFLTSCRTLLAMNPNPTSNAFMNQQAAFSSQQATDASAHQQMATPPPMPMGF